MRARGWRIGARFAPWSLRIPLVAMGISSAEETLEGAADPVARVPSGFGPQDGACVSPSAFPIGLVRDEEPRAVRVRERRARGARGLPHVAQEAGKIFRARLERGRGLD